MYYWFLDFHCYKLYKINYSNNNEKLNMSRRMGPIATVNLVVFL